MLCHCQCEVNVFYSKSLWLKFANAVHCGVIRSFRDLKFFACFWEVNKPVLSAIIMTVSYSTDMFALEVFFISQGIVKQYYTIASKQQSWVQTPRKTSDYIVCGVGTFSPCPAAQVSVQKQESEVSVSSSTNRVIYYPKC